MLDFGLTVLCIGGAAALVVLAESYRRRVGYIARELDLRAEDLANDRRRLDLDERELSLEEWEIRNDQDDDDGFRTGRGPHF